MLGLGPARLILRPAPGPERWVFGAQLAVVAYALFACQDAALKYLLTSFAIWQLLAVRSAVILIACLAVGGRSVVRRSYRSPVRWALAARAATSLAAWWCFFEAAKTLPMGQLVTLYLVAPILATGLSATFLGERMSLRDYGAIGFGVAGTLAAFNPADLAASWAMALVLAGAGLWAITMVLMRWIGRREQSVIQLASNNIVFFLAATVMTVGNWHMPSAAQFLMMMGVGVLSGVGQWLLIGSAKHAPVTVTAPLQYTGLVWAFLLGFVVWGNIPSLNVIVGAVLIGMAGFSALARRPFALSLKKPASLSSPKPAH